METTITDLDSISLSGYVMVYKKEESLSIIQRQPVTDRWQILNYPLLGS